MSAAEGSDAGVGRAPGQGGTGVVLRPALIGRLDQARRVTVVSAPAGSGKTVLLRSWMSETGLADRVAWVSAGPDGRDPSRFWLQVLRALSQTTPGAALVQEVSAAPDLDGWGLVEGLLRDLAALGDPLWLVVDDVHELGSAEALRQLELLVMRAPSPLQFVLAARHDVRLGLHRLRLEGGLTEIRAADLRFSLTEAEELLVAAGVELPEAALASLHGRTEGWVAGLRLAALALAGHPEPARFAAEFSGTERTVAEYLLAEVLDRQDEQVRRLLLRTSILERVNGELAGLLTGCDSGERVLQDLEQANGFVVSLDPARSWFRYHQMFADLLQVELRRAAPGEVAELHRSAGEWFAAHGFAREAIHHAQAARDWPVAVRLLADSWPNLYLDGHATTVHELLADFPSGLAASDAELAVVAAADQLAQGSLEEAERYLRVGERGMAAVPEARRGSAQLPLGVVSMFLAARRGNLSGVAEHARRLAASAEEADATEPVMPQGLSAMAFIALGSAEFWAGDPDDSLRHLETAVALARQAGRPRPEFVGLAYQALTELFELDRPLARATEHARPAVELARTHGWTDDPVAGIAYLVLAAVPFEQGRLDEAEPWLEHAERTLRAETDPAGSMAVRSLRGLLELARGDGQHALAAVESAERLAGRVSPGHYLVLRTQALVVHALVRLGETERARQVLARLSAEDRGDGDVLIAEATLQLALGDPQTALATLTPALDDPAPRTWRIESIHDRTLDKSIHARVLEAVLRDALDDPAAAEDALERALDLAEPDGRLSPFLLCRAPGLLERHARHRSAHASLLAEIQNLLSGAPASPGHRSQPVFDPLSDSELRVLRYLPTNLTAPEIARELYVSPNTVRTHVRNLYAKLGTHRRAEAVETARAVGLLAPAGRGRTKAAQLTPD